MNLILEHSGRIISNISAAHDPVNPPFSECWANVTGSPKLGAECAWFFRVTLREVEVYYSRVIGLIRAVF